MAVTAEDRTLSPSARETLRVPVVWLSWFPAGACTLVFAAGLSVSTEWRYLPLAVSVLLLGLPHGAVDWTALPRAAVGQLDARWVGVVLAVYIAAGGAYAAGWFLAPVGAAVAFVALTWLHWGQGELYPLVTLLGADHLATRWRRALTVVVRGGIPMLVPLVAFPGRYRAVVDSFVAPFGSRVSAWPGPTARLALAVGFAALTLGTLAVGYRAATDRRAWAVDAGETVLLWAFFLVVPPVLAVGVYFCCWHATRHIARVLALDPAATAALDRGRLVPALGRFAREAALPTAGALALAWALWTATPDPSPTVEGVAAVYLVTIAVVTLPHVVVVTWLDRLQGY
jgi:Brp/Blh family beta-carotene 15,15'-monooxygenase